MDIFTKIKSFWGRPKTSGQDYLKIKSELRVSDIRVNGGINFKVAFRGSIVPFWLSGDAGITEETAKPKIQEALTKIAISLGQGLNLVEISQSLKNQVPL